MRQIRIIFTMPKKYMIGAEAISWYMKRPYSHVALEFDAISINRTLTYQASLGMVHFCNSRRFTYGNNIVRSYTINVTDEQYKQLLQACVDRSGEEYSYIDLALILINDIADRLGIKCQWNDPKGFVCSELMADILEDVFNTKFNKPKFLIKPSDIEDFLVNNI